jgi:hypothetical protein
LIADRAIDDPSLQLERHMVSGKITAASRHSHG